jgi:hypothetical protein
MSRDLFIYQAGEEFLWRARPAFTTIAGVGRKRGKIVEVYTPDRAASGLWLYKEKDRERNNSYNVLVCKTTQKKTEEKKK